MNNKEKYRNLCNTEQSIPVWHKAWWLDAVCGDDWQVLIVEKNGSIVAALPYVITKGRFGLGQIKMPKLTQALGVWTKYPDGQKYVTKISYEKEVYTKIIEQIELLGLSVFHQNFNYKVTNWLPFMWRGYSQTTRYTYIIEDLCCIDSIFDNFDSSKKRSIRKAEKQLTVKQDLSPEKFYEHQSVSLLKRGKKINYTFKEFEKLYKLAYKNNSGKSFYCYDINNNIHAAILIVWDENSAYYLICSVDEDFRSSGGNDLLVFEAIKYSSSITKSFDFEGSVIESWEASYRNFGGTQKPYFSISKTFSPGLMIVNGLMEAKIGLKKFIKEIMS